MMAIFTALMLLGVEIQWERAPETKRALVEAWVDALRADDLIAFCSCWDTWRQRSEAIDAFRAGGEEFSRQTKMLERIHYRSRNEEIEAAHKSIRKLFSDLGVIRESIRPESFSGALRDSYGKLKPTGKLKRTGKFEFTVKPTGGFRITTVSNRGAIRITVPGAAFVDGRWYFSAAPSRIDIGEHSYDLPSGELRAKNEG